MGKALRLQSRTPEETRLLGESLAALLTPGDVVLLAGELGAGKTTFVQGMARGLGYGGGVSSKSFVLLGQYDGRVKLYHADLYRLEHPEEVQDLALEELSADGVLVVEWPERAEYLLPEENIKIRLEVTGEETRVLQLEAIGRRPAEILSQLKAGSSCD